MFPQQKERVARYWVSGAGCSKIATALGLSVNTVKSFCRRNSVEMHNQTETAPDKYMEVVCTDRCPQRNVVLRQMTGRRQKRFCFHKCRMA